MELKTMKSLDDCQSVLSQYLAFPTVASIHLCNRIAFLILLVSCHIMLPALFTRKVHKYGKSTTGESWDIVVDEETYYE